MIQRLQVTLIRRALAHARMHACTHACTHAHTHARTQPFYSSMDFVRDNLGEPVPEETFTYSHLSWSSIVAYLLLPSNTIYGILLVQSTCLTVFFHKLSPSFVWSTSWPGTLHFILIRFFTQLLSYFRNTCPCHRSLFCCSTKIMSSNPSLSLNPLFHSFIHSCLFAQTQCKM